MDQEKWENGETRLVEQLEYAIKPNQEKLEHVNIGTNDNIKELKVGTLILIGEKRNLIKLLKEYTNVFIWSYVDMFGLDTNIITHKISLI